MEKRTKHQEKTWPMIAHLSALAGFVIPLGLLLGPLFVYFLKKNSDSETREHARRAFNFQLAAQLMMLLVTIPPVLQIKYYHSQFIKGLEEHQVLAKSNPSLEALEKHSAELKVLENHLSGKTKTSLLQFGYYAAILIQFLATGMAILNSIKAFQDRKIWYFPSLNIIKR